MTGTEPHAPRGTTGRGPNWDRGPRAGHAGAARALYEAAPPAVGSTGTIGRARAAGATRRRMHISAPPAARAILGSRAASGPEKMRDSEWSHVLTGDSVLTRCPHRLTRWSLEVAPLHHRVHRSRYPVPPPLDNAPYLYFLPEAQTHLRSWMDQKKIAITVRQHAVRESYEKSRHNNLQALRKKRKAAHGVLDKYTIQEALGKCQPRQRMWGVSSQAPGDPGLTHDD